MHTAKSGAPNLRSDEKRQFFGRQIARLYLSWVKRSPALGSSPVLVRLAAGATPLLLLGLALVVTAVALGPYTIPLSHTVDILLAEVGVGDTTAPQTEQAIVASVRLPRVALSLIVGAALGVAGAVMQGLFRNPMADPGIIGVSTGGALGAVVAISTGAQAAFALALPAMSFAGATGSLVLVYAVASVGGRFSMSALLLSGIAVGAFLAAIISAFILFTENLEAQRDMLFWLAGGLDASRWSEVHLALPFVALGLAMAVFLARDLNLLMVSDDEARSLGVRVGLTRNSLLLAASLITGNSSGLFGDNRLRWADRAARSSPDDRCRPPGAGTSERPRRRRLPAGSGHSGPAGDCPCRGQRGNHHGAGGRAILPDAARPQQGAGVNALGQNSI